MEETEEQLRTMCYLTDEDNRLIERCTAHKRRIELLAVRALLKAVGINQTIHYNDRKPYLDDGYISISHSANMAAIIWNKNFPVGIDIEKLSPRILRIAERVFSDKELETAAGDIEKLTIMWNCKECVFKLANDEGIDFREMIEVKNIPLVKRSRNGGLIEATLTKSGKIQHFSLFAMKVEDNTVVWGKGRLKS